MGATSRRFNIHFHSFQLPMIFNFQIRNHWVYFDKFDLLKTKGLQENNEDPSLNLSLISVVSRGLPFPPALSLEVNEGLCFIHLVEMNGNEY